MSALAARYLLKGAAMHTIPFGLKRGHYCCLRMLRPLAARFDLTPARIDLLVALNAFANTSNPYECNIAQKLGVARSTVCRMVRSLVTAGFLEEPCPPPKAEGVDRRFRLLTFTRYGRRVFDRVLKMLSRRTVDRGLHRAIAPMRLSRTDRAFYLFGMIGRVERLARGLGDESHLYG